MGEALHGSAPTTHAIRAAIQRSQASIAELSRTYGVNPKTVAKWRKRDSVADAPMEPNEPRSSVLSKEEEALVVTFRRHTLLPLDDCLYALQATNPHLTCSSLHCCFKRNDNGTHVTDPAGDSWTPTDIKRMPAAGDRFRCHAFEFACAQNDIDHRQNGPRVLVGPIDRPALRASTAHVTNHRRWPRYYGESPVRLSWHRLMEG